MTSLAQESKRVIQAKYVSNYTSIFTCPICDAPMNVVEFQRMVCTSKHSFDFAKQGYINLLTQPVNSKYRKDLFEARRNLIVNTNFFEALCKSMANKIDDYLHTEEKSIYILDSGCGEGSHLANISEKVHSHIKRNIVGVGIDIAKEGMMVAAKNYNNKIWTVADLAHTPFANETFHVILNILSPSNYEEFKRLLKPNGIVLKVVPQSGYLKELREYLFDEPIKQKYTNEKTVSRFKEQFSILDYSRITYKVKLSKEFLPSFVEMTPLTWTTSKEDLTSILQKEFMEITVDFDLLIGEKTT